MTSTTTSTDEGRYPVDPFTYFGQAASSYDASYMPLKTIGRHLLTLGLTPLSQFSVVHDNACGTGTVTNELLAHVPPNVTAEADPRNGLLAEHDRDAEAQGRRSRRCRS